MKIGPHHPNLGPQSRESVLEFFGIFGIFGILGLLAFVRVEKLTKALKEKGILDTDYKDD